MAIEDILQVKETVRGNPMGDPQAVNQMEFLRFQEQMGLGQGEVVGKLIQMFMEAPSEFTAKFGVESADAIRELMEMTTQRELEKQGNVFRDNSAEIIGKNISMNLPENSAIGTLQTDQANKAEMMIEFMKKQLQFGEGLQQSLQDEIGPQSFLKALKEGETTGRFRVLGHDQAQEMGLPVDSGQIYQMNEMTGKVEVLEGTTTSGRHRILDVEEAQEMGLPVDQGQIWELNQMTGQVNLLDTGDAGDAEKPEWITQEDGKNYQKEEKNFLVDIMKDIIQGGMDTGSGIINAIMDEAKQLYREHTEKSADYDPKFFEKEQLNETTEDYHPPQP